MSRLFLPFRSSGVPNSRIIAATVFNQRRRGANRNTDQTGLLRDVDPKKDIGVVDRGGETQWIKAAGILMQIEKRGKEGHEQNCGTTGRRRTAAGESQGRQAEHRAPGRALSKSLEAERVDALPSDRARGRDAVLEFALAGCLAGKALSDYAGHLHEQYPLDEAFALFRDRAFSGVRFHWPHVIARGSRNCGTCTRRT